MRNLTLSFLERISWKGFQKGLKQSQVVGKEESGPK
jgi:hypothetical protein